MPKRILLADDSITIQKVVELTFSDGDYEIVSANNGARALQKLAESMPDIILSDIIMPEKNGYEVCEFVKSHPEYRDIPVILLTGTFEPFDPDRAEKAGCDAVVTKPFESQSLINKVEELIQRRRTRLDESQAAQGDAFVSQPLDSFIASPAIEQPAQAESPGMTMPWQMPTVDQGSGEPGPDAEGPFSEEEPTPPPAAPQEESPFGSDGGWQPISTEPEPSGEESPAEPFDPGPSPDDTESSAGFEGESIFAPQDAQPEPEDGAGEESGADHVTEPASADEEPFAPAEQSAEAAAEDASTRAWAVPVDGVWAEPAVTDEHEESETGRTLSFPASSEPDASDEAAPSDEAVIPDHEAQSPWGQPAERSEAKQQDDGISAEPPVVIEEGAEPNDVWNVEPVEEESAPAEQEQADPESLVAASEASRESDPWRSDEETAAPAEEMPSEVASTSRQAGRSLTD
ncbi:MAG TPA: response regulator, partial [Thermoanaerobaculia bacterium]|nr:response regulator [Thermoanaerobaculia bacterium]